MGTCIVILTNKKNEKVELQYPSTAVEKNFPQGGKFTPAELLKTMSENVDVCHKRIEQSLGKRFADGLMSLEGQINASSKKIIELSLINSEEEYTVLSARTDACAFQISDRTKKP